MLEALKETINIILLSFGLEINIGAIFMYVFYTASGPVILILLYVVAWNKVKKYSNLMDRYVLELWTKEEVEVGESLGSSEEVKKMRLERLKREYEDKINYVQGKRDILFKVVPFLKWYYRRKKGKNAPMYTLP